MAVGRRLVLVWDGFVGWHQGGLRVAPGRRPARGGDSDETLYGGRFELVVKF
jgi:hypothetical protein